MATKKTAARKPKTKEPEAIAMLMEDHRKVEKLFSDFKESEDEDEKESICQTVCAMLTVHTTIEEEVFYPAARDALEEGDMLDEAEVEHDVAKNLIAQLQGGEMEGDKRDATVEVLGEYVQHHVEEEENELFKALKKTEMDFDDVAERMSTRKEALEAEMGLSDDSDEEEEEEEDVESSSTR